MEKNLVDDIELAWAEYEYIRSTVVAKMYEIINDDIKANDKIDDRYVNIDMEDTTIIIVLSSNIKLSTLVKISDLLGVDAIITSSNKKHLKVVFN